MLETSSLDYELWGFLSYTGVGSVILSTNSPGETPLNT